MERQRACLYCGSSDIMLGLILDQTADPGHIGLQYKTWKILRTTEPLRADVCRSCGTVFRFYVKERGRDWVVDEESTRSVPASKSPGQ